MNREGHPVDPELDTDVIVVGAGPTGLMLAAELRLGGAHVILTETLEKPTGQSRALGFTTRTLETFDQRGLLPRFGPIEISPIGHFGSIPMDYTVLPDANFGARGIPQSVTETILEEWATELGTDIRRGHTLNTFTQNDHHVTATLTTPDGNHHHLRARYLVGADGAHSTVRKTAGIDFPGTPATQLMYLADITHTNVKLRPLGERLEKGLVQVFPMPNNVARIILCEYPTHTPGAPNTPQTPDGPEGPDYQHIADAWQRVTGEDIHTATPLWTSTFTDTTRLATTYRKNRILLAGDAAHIHLPAGGQGMSAGIQDAVNLGWKLAATTQGWAPPHLLDTYHTERHPIGHQLITNTQAQGLAIFGQNHSQPLRDFYTEILTIPQVQQHLAGTISHTTIQYTTQPPNTPTHPHTGKRLPPRTLNTPNGPTPTPQLLHPAKTILINQTNNPHINNTTTGYTNRLTTHTGTLTNPHPYTTTDTLLIRPDGYIAYAGTNPTHLTTHLHHYLGTPTPQ
jgi:bifunctional hydroxylase/dehydrase